jgi:outer membrane receptor for ferrienterochelin and colicin
MDSRKERLTAGFLGMLFVMLSPPALATEPLTKEEELQFLKEETVSIAARHEQPISQAPSNVYVVTDEDIRQSGAPDLPTVLRRIPGLEVMQMTGAEFNVSARGDNQTDANKMLVMVDGRSIYVDIQGTVFWKAIPVTLPEIKRIEVLIGPASVLYGFNAFDGIINIITKSPEEMKGTTLQFGGGEFGTISSAAIQAGTVGKFGYRLSAGHDQNQQWRNRDALAFRDNKFNLQTEYALTSDSKLLVSGGLVDVNRFDGPITEVVAQSTRPSQGYADVAYERPNFFLRAWWTEFNVTSDQGVNPLLANFLRVTDRNGSSQENGTFNTYNVEAQHTLQIGGANQLTYGVNYRLNTAADNNLDGFSHENRFGIYVNDQWHVTQTLSIVGGARYDLDTFIHPTISPRLALIYQVAPEHTVRAALSVAYRPPTIFERHLNVLGNVMLPPPIPSPPPTPSLGSTNLNPEEIVSYDLGYQGWFVRHRLRVRGDLFFNHISNLINNRPTASGIAAYVNDPGQADIYGGAAGVEFLATRWLSGFANFSYEEIGQSFTDTVRRGAPRFKANAGVRGEWENGLSGEAALYHVGAATYPIANSFTAFSPFFPPGVTVPSTRVGSYNLLNLRAGYRFWHEKAEVAVSAFNAWNDRHKEDPLGDTIGSRVMGWLTLRF